MKFQTVIATLALVVGGAAFAQVPAQVPASAPQTPKLDERQVNQQQRVDQGVVSGQLNEKEAGRMEKREEKLAAREANAKADGKVSRAERTILRRDAHRNSAAIYRQKHDQQTAAK